MTISLNSGSFHVFKANNGAYLPIWEKEPGVFLTIEGEEPTEFLRKALEHFDGHLQHRKSNVRKAKVIKSIMDLSMEDMRIEGIEDLMDEEGLGGKSRAERFKEVEDALAKSDRDLIEMESNRVELCDFIIMCGVSPSKDDNSENETASFMKKLTGTTKPEDE